MIRKATAILAGAVIVSAAILASAAPVLADGPGTWPSVPGFDKEDFFKIAGTGFGDPMNNYAFSMTMFRGDVYVGTNRNFLCQVLEAVQDAGFIPPGYEFTHITCPAGDPWSWERARDMCGEIWRYRNSEWKLVYRSEPVFLPGYLPLPGLPPEGGWVAKEPGFRSMVTFIDKRGEPAIYAASGISLVPGRLLLKSTDGITWDPVVTPLAMGSDSRSMAVHNGKLYVGPNIYTANASIWATDDPSTTGDGSNWQMVADFTAEGPGTNVAVISMASFHGYLYAGTQNDEAGFQVWRSNARRPYDPEPGQWTQIVDYGAGDMANTRALTMEVFKGKLYVGSSMFPLSTQPPYLLPPKGFELVRINTDDSWELLIGDSFARIPPPGDGSPRMPSSGWPGGFANFLNLYCWSLQENDGVLYLGTFDASSFLQFVPIEEIVELPEFAEFFQLIEDNKEEIITCLEEVIDDLEERGADEEWIEPLRLLVEALEDEPIDWVGMWQIFIDYFAGADLWKTQDGIIWEPVMLNGFDNQNNYGFRTMVSGSLYVGTANPFQGLEVWQAPPVVPPPVGGEAYPVNKASLLAPWIGLGVILFAVAAFIVLRRKQAAR